MFRNVMLTILLVIFFQASAAAARDVLVVRNSRAKPYAEALQGFRSVLKSEVDELVISELNGEDVATEVRRRNPDLVVAMGMESLSEVRKIREKPIVYLMVLRPDSLLRGEKNITGVSMIIPPEKQLANFQRVLPRLKRIGLIYNPANTGHLVARAVRAAGKSGVELTTLKAHKSSDFPRLLDSIQGDIDAYWMVPDSTTVTPQSVEYLLLFSMQNRVPILTFSEKYLELGASLALEINTFKIGRQAGEMAEKILAGCDVADIPATDASDADLTVNYRILHKMGIHSPAEAVNNYKAPR